LFAKQKEIEAVMVKLMDRRAQMKIECRRLLTPEQIQKLDMMPHRGGGHDLAFNKGNNRCCDRDG